MDDKAKVLHNKILKECKDYYQTLYNKKKNKANKQHKTNPCLITYS